MCRYHKHFTEFQKQHRQNEITGQEDFPTRVKVTVIGDHGHV